MASYQPKTSQCHFLLWDRQYFYYWIFTVSLVGSVIMTVPDPHLGLIRRRTLTIIGTWPNGYSSAQESQWNILLGQNNWLSH